MSSSTLVRIVAVITILSLSFIDCKSKFETSSNGNILNRSKPQCTDKALRKVGIQMTNLIGFGANSRPFPSSDKKLNEYCKQTFSILRQVESFVKSCFKKEIVHLASVYLFSVRSTFNRRVCGSKKAKKQVAPLVADAACINRHYFPNDRCVSTFINRTAQLVTLDDDKQKFPHVCCNSIALTGCLNGQIDAHACLVPHRERLLALIHGASSGVSDMTCGEFNESSDRCEQLGPAPIPAVPNRKHYPAAVLVLIDLIVSMKKFAINE